MKRFVKILHEIATVGMMGTIAAVLVLLASARGTSAAEYAVLRRGIDLLVRWLLFPSLGLVLFTGLIAMAIHHPFQNAGWVWIKALLGVSVFEGTLGGIVGTAREAAAVSSQVAAGTADGTKLAPILLHERGVLWFMLFLALVNIVLAVWRPRLIRKSRPVPAAAPPVSEEPEPAD